MRLCRTVAVCVSATFVGKEPGEGEVLFEVNPVSDHPILPTSCLLRMDVSCLTSWGGLKGETENEALVSSSTADGRVAGFTIVSLASTVVGMTGKDLSVDGTRGIGCWPFWLRIGGVEYSFGSPVIGGSSVVEDRRLVASIGSGTERS